MRWTTVGRLAAAGALTGSLIAVSGAGASASAFVPVNPGDHVRVAGSALTCKMATNGAVCFVSQHDAPRPKSYFVKLVTPGVASIFEVTSRGKTTLSASYRAKGKLTHRAGTPAQGTPRALVLKMNQVALLTLATFRETFRCAVIRNENVPTVVCAFATELGKVMPRSYAVLINERRATILDNYSDAVEDNCHEYVLEKPDNDCLS